MIQLYYCFYCILHIVFMSIKYFKNCKMFFLFIREGFTYPTLQITNVLLCFVFMSQQCNTYMYDRFKTLLTNIDIIYWTLQNVYKIKVSLT